MVKAPLPPPPNAIPEFCSYTIVQIAFGGGAKGGGG